MMTFEFQYHSQFALLAVKNVDTDVPSSAFQLSNGIWVMPRVPVRDLGIWKEWIGSLQMERLSYRGRGAG